MLKDISGYRFEDLFKAGIVKSRTDLARKQRESKFPLPAKLGKRQAWFPAAEVLAWLNAQVEKRVAATREPAPAVKSKKKPAKRRVAARA
jgi:predicted DNA-binding transcriptional regulator AlpA